MNIYDIIKTDENEKPLDNLVTDGGFCSVFRTICCVGDSLSSGEFEGTNEKGEKTFHDFYEYSWGQFIARSAGCKVYNFSRGGMTAKEYCESFADDNGLWDKNKAAQAYIIALGVNDLNLKANNEIGSENDVCAEDYTKNKDTVAGWYARIIQRYKKISPDAKFFFVTMPRAECSDEKEAAVKERRRKFSEVLRRFAEIFDNSYVIDLEKYFPVMDKEYNKKFKLGGHLNPMGYILTAKAVSSYIDYIIRHNYADFKQVGFIGTPFKNTVDIQK